MINDENKKEYYQALLSKNPEYEGIFFVGVTTTGVFCRPTCPARKPKFENCEFFKTAQQALSALFRPCKRCQPLSHPNQISKLIQYLIKEIEKSPEKRWKDEDFKHLVVDVSTVRRQFKKRFNMTFVEYAGARRMELAVEQIKGGETVIEAQLSTGYESSSGFREAFTRIIGTAPTKLKDSPILKVAWLDTPLGLMVAIGNDAALFLLSFVDCNGLEQKIERLKRKTKSVIIPGQATSISLIEKELVLYFKGELHIFKTPLCLLGTPFQKHVWSELLKILNGETRSYAEIATLIGKSSACRAVAQANGANHFAVIIPCHRIINANGGLGGYGGGSKRKQWLLNHERKIK